MSAPAALFTLAATDETVGFRWLSAPPAWATFLIVLGVFGFAIVAYLLEHTPAGRGRRALFAALRAAAILGVALVLFEPVETRTREEVRDSFAIVMIDESLSMSFADRFSTREPAERLARAVDLEPSQVEDRPRIELVRRALAHSENAALRGLAAKNRVKVYTFSSRPRPIAEIEREGTAKAGSAPGASTGAGAGAVAGPGAFLDRIEASGAETAIGDSLNRVMNEMRGQHVAGIVLITDGRHNAGAEPPLRVARRLKQRGIPLFTVGVGNPEEPKDIAVTDLQAPDVVIVGDVMPVKLTVKSQGFEGEEARADVIARLDDEIVRSEPIALQGKGRPQEVGIRVKAERAGEYALSVEIPPRPGEQFANNNKTPPKRIRVIDKRIKVLYVESLPRWEFRYLRWGLVRDKNMEAQTYQISADPEFVQDSSPGVPPLTGIPSTREELFQYHVIAIGDVDPQDLGEERMKLIREFVEDGGGLLLIAGRQFMPRAYAGTPLEPLIPVKVESTDDFFGAGRPIRESFRPKLTADGRRHPIMQLENDPEENAALWEGRGDYAPGLPGFYWHYRARERKKSAEVLATHPDALTSKQEPSPVFALQPAGAGTVFFSATDEVWRWRAGVGDRYAYRFWGQVMRYLSTGRLLRSKRFSITTDKSIYDLGEKVRIMADVADRNMKPLEEETQAAYIQGPDGQVEKIELARPPGTLGRYEATRAASKVGSWKVWIAGGPNPERPEPGEELDIRNFEVQVPVLEMADPKMDEELLRKLAAATGGKYFALDEIADLPEAVGTIREVSEVRIAERELWDRWWVIVAVVALLTTEWVLRKRWKMV
jgi:hypothetical protein